jgi:hypothetical protein
MCTLSLAPPKIKVTSFPSSAGIGPFISLVSRYETVVIFTIIGKREKLQDVHNISEADRFIQALFMSHVFI